MRNNMYDDDNSYPYKKPKENHGFAEDEDEIYAKQYDDLMNASDEYSSSASKRNSIITMSVILGIVVVLAVVLFVTKSQTPKSDTEPEAVTSSADELQTTNVDSLIKTGEHYISTGDYESAEDIYKKLLDTAPDNDDVYTMHSVLFNFNKAIDAFDSKNYSKARRFHDKIPAAYSDYDTLREDVDDLDDEITNGENACSELAEAADLIYEEKFEEALEILDFIDDDYLTADDRKLLGDYRDKAESGNDDESDEDNSDADTDDKTRTEDPVTFSSSDAETFIEDYCKAFADATATHNFNPVSAYISKSSDLYNQQKKVIDSCGENGITKSFDGLVVNSQRKLSPTKWLINVTESETTYFSDGSSESATHTYNYTVEYINSAFYLTKITTA